MDYAIIAAGEGSRLAREGVELPKPLVRLQGVPLIDRLIDIFSRNEAESISIIVNKEMTAVREHLEKKVFSVPFNLIVQSTPSSMHSFSELSKFLKNGKFCLTTVDTIFREDEFSRFIRSFEQDGESDGMMAVTGFIDDEKPLYIAVDQETMRIKDFYDSKQDGISYISGGIYGLTPKAIPVLDKCMQEGISRMRNYQRRLIQEGLQLKAYPFSKIIDVDHAGDIPKAEDFILNIYEN